MGNNRFVSYSDEEKEIVRQGIDAIRSVLKGDDESAKQSLLLCLDWFMDPYYGQDISDIMDELIILLQEVVVSDKSIHVKEDALELLSSYVDGPFSILEENIGNIDEKLLPQVEYAVNYHRIELIKPIMIDECNRLYKECKDGFPEISDRYWVLYNTNLTKDSGKPEIEMSWLFDKGELMEGVSYTGSAFSMRTERGFYSRPEIHFNIDLKNSKALITYYFATRYARCLEYDLICVDGKYSLSNRTDVWAG